jgi:integrase
MLAGETPDQLAPNTAASQQRTSLGAVLQATYKDRWQGIKSEVTAYRNGEAWCKALGDDFDVTTMGPAEVTAVVDGWVAEGNKPATVNRKLAALGVMLKVAVERGLIDRAFRLPKKKEYEGRLRYYSDAEVDGLIAFVSGHGYIRSLFILAVETGLRQSEMLGLTKRDVDLKRGLVLLGETKGNKRRSVPLTEAAKAALKFPMDAAAHDHDRLFPTFLTPSHISRLIAGWKRSVGLPKDDEACFHTFRHTCCSRLVQAGVPLIVVQKWMGHSAIQTTMRYAHLAPDSLDVALVALNNRNGEAA